MIVLRELATQIRDATCYYLDACPTENLCWAPEGTSNHLLWHAGHALWVQDILSLVPLTGKSALPENWEERFGMNCQSPKLTKQWPSKEELMQLLVDQSHQLDKLYQEHAERLSEIREEVTNDWELTQGVIHGWHDEAKHQGEMFLLSKMKRV